MSAVDLVVTDLDGLLVATGRRLASTRTPLGRLGLTPPAVMLNGGLGIDLESGDRFHVGGFDPADAAAVLEVFLGFNVQPCVYTDRDEPSVRVGDRPATHPRHLAGFGSDVTVDDLQSVVARELILAFSLLGLDAVLAGQLEQALSAHAVPHHGVDRQYGGHSITVAPHNMSKWDGIVAFCDTRRIDPARTMVIGDGANDIEMLEQAAVAVVPADGHPRALDRADHVVPAAADGGWAEILSLL